MGSTPMPEYDPLDLAHEIANARGWNNYFDQSADDVLYIEMPSRYKQLTLVVSWSSTADLLMLRIHTPLTFVIPDYALGELCKLLNYCNSRTVTGAWYFETIAQKHSVITWRQEVPVDQDSLTHVQMDSVLAMSSFAYDAFFPALMAFLGAKPRYRPANDGSLELVALDISAADAFAYIDQSTITGRA